KPMHYTWRRGRRCPSFGRHYERRGSASSLGSRPALMCDATRPAMDADFRVLLGRQPQRLASGANHLASCPIGLQPAESESYRPQHDEPLARAGVQSQNMTSGRWGSLMRYGTDAGGRSRGKKALLARMLTA